MERTVIVLDSFEYKLKEKELQKSIENICNPIFVYTRYENALTEIFQRTKLVGGFLTHISYWLLSLIYALRLLKCRNKKRIIFINPIVGIFYAAICRILCINTIISIAGFLFENKQSRLYYAIRKKFVNFCYKKVETIILYGRDEQKLYSNIFPKLKDKFVFVQYGKDYNYKKVKHFNHSREYISSGGRSNRNYQTLCDAMRGIDNSQRIDCLVATRPECVTPSMLNCNVDFIYGITLNQFGSFIKGSKLFILPLRDTNISAGHMSMMEAMAVRVPVIVTDIPSIRDYVDDNCVFFYNANDACDLRRKIIFIVGNLDSDIVKNKVKNAWALYNKEYSFQSLLQRIVNTSIYVSPPRL